MGWRGQKYKSQVSIKKSVSLFKKHTKGQIFDQETLTAVETSKLKKTRKSLLKSGLFFLPISLKKSIDVFIPPSCTLQGIHYITYSGNSTLMLIYYLQISKHWLKNSERTRLSWYQTTTTPDHICLDIFMGKLIWDWPPNQQKKKKLGKSNLKRNCNDFNWDNFD